MQASGAFGIFFADAEPRLRRALVARFGIHAGREATVDALAYGWENWARVGAMDNPVGYLYRVGVSRATSFRAPPRLVSVEDHREPWVEPGLERTLDSLSESQRVAVVLRHSFEWSYEEIAELLEVSVSTVRNHLERGMTKLRSGLDVGADD